MSKKPVRKKVRDIVFCVLSFVLSLLLFLNTVCIFTVAFAVNENAWIDQMNESNYFSDKADEIENKLISLGSASGLKPEFFENFIDPIWITNDTQAYMDAYFHGNDDVINHSTFKRNFQSQLDKYITENNVKVDEENVEYLVDKAENIYSASLEIPLFNRLSGKINFLSGIMPMVIAVLTMFSLVIVLVLLFGNKWRHRAFKYYYFACAGTCLSLFTAAVFLTVSGGLKNIVLESRAIYDMVVSFGTAVTTAVWVFAAFFFIMAFVMFVVYSRLIRKVVSTD